MKKIIFAFTLALGIGSTFGQKPQPSPTPKPPTGTDAAKQKGQPTKSRTGTDGRHMPVVVTRVTAKDISRTPAGKKYVIYLTRRGSSVFEFDSTSGEIDFSRITVRASGHDVPMQTLLEKLLPDPADRSGNLRVGQPRDLRRGKAPKGRRPPNFTCAGGICTCSGDDDCNNMFGAGVCGDIAACDPAGCSCLPPIKN